MSLVAATLSAGLLASACAVEPQPLRIGNNLWPGYELSHLAHALGYDNGANVRLIDFSSAAEVVRAYRDGLLDVAAVTADEALQAGAGGGANRIVLVCDTSDGADVIMATSGIASMQDLRGKRVGVETTVLGAFVLARALDLNGMTPADVTVVPVPLPEHEAAFVSGRVDAVVTFEPNRSRVLARGGHAVFDSAAMPGEIADVLLTRSVLPPEQEAALQQVVQGWFRALAFLRTSPDQAAVHIAPRLGLPIPAFLDSLALLEMPDRAGNLRMLGGPAPAMRRTLDSLAAHMLDLKLIDAGVDMPALDPSLVERAVP